MKVQLGDLLLDKRSGRTALVHTITKDGILADTASGDGGYEENSIPQLYLLSGKGRDWDIVRSLNNPAKAIRMNCHYTLVDLDREVSNAHLYSEARLKEIIIDNYLYNHSEP